MHGQRRRPPSAPPPHSPRLAPALRSVARARGHAAATRPSASGKDTGRVWQASVPRSGRTAGGRVVACISVDKGACGPGGCGASLVGAHYALPPSMGLRFSGRRARWRLCLLGGGHTRHSGAGSAPSGVRRSLRGSGRHCGADTSPADRPRHSGAGRATA